MYVTSRREGVRKRPPAHKEAAKTTAAEMALQGTAFQPFPIPSHRREDFQRIADDLCPSEDEGGIEDPEEQSDDDDDYKDW